MSTVSIIIPARNEIYLEKTILSVINAAKGDIEVIVILDGYIPEPQINVNDNRVIFYHFEKSIGQRQAVNYGAKVANGKYIMKLDAHCAVDDGFDVKLAMDCDYTWTVIPRMYNLDIRTWKPKFIDNYEMAVAARKLHDYMYIGWNEKNELRTLYYPDKLNKELHKRKEMIDDTMSCMGCCFFMHKDRFWELEGLDENHGGWGQMGIEVALKAWLSGGALKVNKNTWFAHWFRGGGGPGFPYKITNAEVEKAREYSKDLWLNDKWHLAKRPFKWVIDKFNPPSWDTNDLTILFYTANVVSDKIMKPVIRSLKKHGYPIISISQKPMDLGKNIVVPEHRSVQNIYRQILIGAKEAKTKYIALCEDDCLYVPEHFKNRPEKAPFAYNLNRWNLHLIEQVYSYRNRPVLSQCIADREALIRNLEERFNLPKIYDKDCGEMGLYEKQLGITEYQYETFSTYNPNLVICHNKNISGRKYIGKDAEPTKELPFWGKIDYWIKKFGGNGISNSTNIYNYPVKTCQYSHIRGEIFEVDELWENREKYGDPRKKDSLKKFLASGRPFFQQIHEGKVFSDEELESHPYYYYLIEKLNPLDRVDRDILTKKGKRHVLNLMKNGINLYHDIKNNGMRNPLDMIRMGDKIFIHRGTRRLEIIKHLKYKRVPCRVFNSKELFNALAPDLDILPDNSIHGLGIQQFMKYQELATDKYWVHDYLKLYDRHLNHLRNRKIKILEIGVFRGASLALWQQAFPNAEVYGLDKDIHLGKVFAGNGIKIFEGRQEDVEFLKREILPVGPFDVIIDDGGHRPLQQQTSFKTLWTALNSGGFYVIEDLYGNYKPEMIKITTMNMLKDMIDEMNIKVTIKSMCFYYNICFIEKK